MRGPAHESRNHVHDPLSAAPAVRAVASSPEGTCATSEVLCGAGALTGALSRHGSGVEYLHGVEKAKIEGMTPSLSFLSLST